MGKSRNDPEATRPGPQGTTLFEAGEIDDVVASPSADREGDIDRAALVGTKPPFLDQRFVLRRGKTTLGRRDGNDIVLPDPSVSARHAWILYDNGQYRLMNVLSTNGTFLNDERIHEAPLADGDRVRFGRAEFVFKAGVTAASRVQQANGVPPWVWLGAGVVLALAVIAVLVL